ncbi:hypothetical protein [Nocardioides sp. 1609]|uniref:hypothetical protein n=1 Tax=Nocardioides sp. 1609 TaxID=2508327 RepID=UPI00106F1EAF|nr:hypothetical protein [Nocardioides sp. 1609]
MKKVLIVTGSGRSGTSSVAGTLKRFGFHVPQPEVEADERNPRGYYEPLWVADFHKFWLNGIPVRTIDSRPLAGDIAMADLTPEREETLRAWLADELAQRADGDVVVIKETRAYWVYPLWQRVVAATGAELASLTMLRHPTQVVRSRDSAYLTGMSDDARLQRETTNVAAWMNSVFVTERATRDNPRAFVPYYDLIGDWRTAMSRACAQVDVDPGDLAPPHDVDDFITSSLNRSSDAWDGLTVPAALRDLAERTWTAANVLVATPDDAAATAELDALATEYADLYVTSAAIASDEATSQVAAARKKLKDRIAAKDERIAELEARVEQLEAAPKRRGWLR